MSEYDGLYPLEMFHFYLIIQYLHVQLVYSASCLTGRIHYKSVAQTNACPHTAASIEYWIWIMVGRVVLKNHKLRGNKQQHLSFKSSFFFFFSKHHGVKLMGDSHHHFRVGTVIRSHCFMPQL